MSNLDYQIFHWINNWAGKNPSLDALGIFLAVYGIYVLIGAGVVLAFWSKYWQNFFLAVASSIISRFVIVELIKIWVNRPRPFETLSVHQLIPDTGSGQSFSSGHAVIMFSIAFSFYGTKWFWPMVILATLSSIARIFVSVHYPLDILASIPIAALTVWAFNALFKKVKFS